MTTFLRVHQLMNDEDVVYYNNAILLNYKNKWNNTICWNMDAPRAYQAKWKRQRKINIIWCHLYVKSKKKIQMILFTKQK